MTQESSRTSRYFTYIQPVLRMPIVKTYGSLIFTIITMIIFILFAIKPTIETIVLLQKDQENQTEILSKLKQKITDLNQGRDNYDRIPPETKDKIETLVPKTPNLSGVISILEQSAQSSGASISAIQFQPLTIEKPSESVIDSKLEEILFTFNVEGSYESLKGVLGSLNSSSRLISITNLVFNKQEGSLIMAVTGKSYYLK